MSQIADLSDVVAQELRVRRFPYVAVYGPERTQRSGLGAQGGVVFERDTTRGYGTVSPPVATRQGAATPKTLRSRLVFGAFTVYAKSPKTGARSRDHEAELDAVCDAVVSAMVKAGELAGKPVAFGSSRFLEENERAEQWPGAVARVEFSVAVPIRDVDYRGRGFGTGMVADVSNTYEAGIVGESD